jgi:glycosyltransferase involved in cell wall biosynthesis/2-polyprenyl-3-methyl-5-hydroxy-6-metoxy-1,4-benzoquinol methylase
MQLTSCPHCRSEAIEPWRHRIDGRDVWACRRCGLRFLREPFDDVASLYSADYFDKNPSESESPPGFGYASYHTTVPADFRWQRSLLDLFTDRPGALLDVGCATARFLVLARAAGFACRGVELSPSAAELTRSMGFDVDRQIEDVSRERRFEVITAWELIEHLPNLRESLVAIRDRLDDGGLFLFSTPDAGAPAVVALGDEWMGVRSSLEHITYLTAEFLGPLLKEVFDTEPLFVSAGGGHYWTLIGIVRRGGLRAQDRARHQALVARAVAETADLPAALAEKVGWFWLQMEDPERAAQTVAAMRAARHDVALAEAYVALRRGDVDAAHEQLAAVVERLGWSEDALQWLWRTSVARRERLAKEVARLQAEEASIRAELDRERRDGREARDQRDAARAAHAAVTDELVRTRTAVGQLEQHISNLRAQLETALAQADSLKEEARLLRVSAGYRIGRSITRVLERMPHAHGAWMRIDELLRNGPKRFVTVRIPQARETVVCAARRLRGADARPGTPITVVAPTAVAPRRSALQYTPVGAGLVPDLVSVILPVYNQADLLAESIESVLAQTYPRFELIVLNDGSRDDVTRVLDRYRAHPKVRILTQPNQGLPKALNNAFEFARGEFWTWTSADNRMEPVQLERMIAFMRSRADVDMTFADYLAIDDRGAPLLDPNFRPQNRRHPTDPEIHVPPDVSTLNTVQDNFIGPCFMYRGHVGLAIGDYDPAMGVEDYDYWMRINDLFKLVHIGVDEVLYQYRVHDNSLNARAAEHKIYERVAALMAYEADRKRAYDQPFTLVADERLKALLQSMDLAPRAVLADASNAGAKRVAVVVGDEPPRSDRTISEPAIVVFSKGSKGPYRWASVLARPDVVAVAPDEETVARVAAAGGRGFGHVELDRAMWVALAALDSTLFYSRTKTAAERARTPAEIYRARDARPTIALEVQAFDKGGLEQVVIDLAVVLRDGGARPIIVVLGALGTAARRAESLGLEVIQLPDIGREQAYRDLIARERIALVNAHYSLFGAKIAAGAGIPFVQTIHNSYIWFQPDEKQAYREADAHTTAYISVSMSVADFSDFNLGLPTEKIVVLPNGIDTARFRPVTTAEKQRLRQKHGITDDVFVFLNVAGIQDPKGHRQLLAAFRDVEARYPRTQLVFAGSAVDAGFRRELEESIKKAGLGDKVKFAGHVGAVEELYAISDAFVLPSFWEGWSLSLAEAVCSGVPVIATDCGAAREVLAETGGELVALPYSSLSELDIPSVRRYINAVDSMRDPLSAALLRVRQAARPPSVSPELRRRYDRAQAFARHRDLFDWLIAGGAPAAARRWLMARVAAAVAVEAESETKSAAG